MPQALIFLFTITYIPVMLLEFFLYALALAIFRGKETKLSMKVRWFNYHISRPWRYIIGRLAACK